MRIRKLPRIPRLPLADLDGVSIQRLGRAGVAELKAFTLDPGALTPPHDHAHTHLVLVLAGSGAVRNGATTQPIGTGDIVATEPHEVHGFMAAPDLDLRFVCVDSPME
jgi:quercetin dioxygenase-like cupin family protein